MSVAIQDSGILRLELLDALLASEKQIWILPSWQHNRSKSCCDDGLALGIVSFVLFQVFCVHEEFSETVFHQGIDGFLGHQVFVVTQETCPSLDAVVAI